jgi:hypothetical protein
MELYHLASHHFICQHYSLITPKYCTIEIRKLEIRQRYLSGKVAYWDARMNGDMELAEQIAAQNQEIAKELK